MEMQVPYSICAEVPQASDIWKDKSRRRKNLTRIKRKERSGDTGSGVLSGSYTYVGSDTTAYERIVIYGILEK